VTYAPGALAEVHGSGGAPVVLLWHGSGVRERDVLAPLAESIAGHGVTVVVPDWQSDDPATGRTHLMASVALALDESDAGDGPAPVTLVGWSLGANAAVHVALHPEVTGGWRPAAVVALAGSYDESPFGDDPFVTGDPSGAGDPVTVGGLRVSVLHGEADTVVPFERSVRAAELISGFGCQVSLHLLDTDHAGIVGTVYDPWRSRCVPTDDPPRLATLAAVAERIARVALAHP
jgi:predicted esterase